MKTKRLVLISLFAALMAVVSPFSIKIGPIPLSFATLIVMLTSFVLGNKDGAIVVFVYILLALFGIPVLSGFKSGAAALFGMTGGYIFGYLPLAFLSSYFGYDNWKNKMLGMLLGTIVLYTFGTIWFMVYTHTALWPSLLACVLPFLPGDFIKMMIVVLTEERLRKILKKKVLICT